ncbi:ribbon-helix-helix protein, CopG family [Tropicimonas isoalkanivorans]|uniref:Uncharacterized protein n=1 Tax=Tropicimonas isoalkanivorans TaxID=441112 RepID=A0A1I1JAP2_9RHOB|nr:ribbon-helix-helix protein, CopG family [Tropicimonas isoalkanivorans]SFC45624.1 hypothetical protein SAMN04488094_10543 [Tropicimonas isoalkanivorans]
MVAIKDRKIAFPRRPNELPRPDLPPQAEANKRQKVLAVRVDPTIKEQFDKFAETTDKSKREIMEDMVKRYIRSQAPAA